MERNICDNCDEKPHSLSYDIADTGVCSMCGCVGECWDHDLIKLYKEFSLTDHQIWESLPRLLYSGFESHESHTLALIGKEIQKLIK